MPPHTANPRPPPPPPTQQTLAQRAQQSKHSQSGQRHQTGTDGLKQDQHWTGPQRKGRTWCTVSCLRTWAKSQDVKFDPCSVWITLHNPDLNVETRAVQCQYFRIRLHSIQLEFLLNQFQPTGFWFGIPIGITKSANHEFLSRGIHDWLNWVYYILDIFCYG